MTRPSATLRLAVVGLLYWSALAGLGFAQQPLSIPIPEDASLEVVRNRIRPDGSQFLLLVRVGESSPIKYVASRQDWVEEESRQLTNLAQVVSLSEASYEQLTQEQSHLERRVQLLADSRDDLLRALAVARSSQAELRGALPSGATSPTGTEGRSDGEESVEILSTTDLAAVAEQESESVATTVEEILEGESVYAGLLEFPIDVDTVRLEIGDVRPDGSQFGLVVHSGAVQLLYVASRNDVVLRQDEELEYLSTLGRLWEQRLANMRFQNELLKRQEALLEADVDDLQQAVSVTRQNIETLTEAIQAQKRSRFEIVMEVLPAIVGIIAAAMK